MSEAKTLRAIDLHEGDAINGSHLKALVRAAVACNLNVVIVALLVMCMVVVPLRNASAAQSSASTRPDLEYLKAVNQAAPPQDPVVSEYSSDAQTTPIRRFACF